MRSRMPVLRILASLAAASIATACSHSSAGGTSNTALDQQHAVGANAGASSATGGAGRPARPSDGYRLADIAVQRLGGANAPNPPVVTGVSVVGEYGLTVYTIGSSSQELLSIKEHGAWRPLGTDAYYPDGRGLVHFGLSPDLAARLIAGLNPPPPR